MVNDKCVTGSDAHAAPQNEFVVLETHAEFASCARRARDIAQEYHHETPIRRSANGWDVLVLPVTLTELSVIESAQQDTVGESPDDDCYEIDDGAELAREIGEDIDDYQDSVARSDETGWYYDDA